MSVGAEPLSAVLTLALSKFSTIPTLRVSPSSCQPASVIAAMDDILTTLEEFLHMVQCDGAAEDDTTLR